MCRAYPPFRHAIGDDVKALPEMLFSSSRVTVLHEASGMALDFTALGALQAWHEEKLPPLQVKVAQVRTQGSSLPPTRRGLGALCALRLWDQRRTTLRLFALLRMCLLTQSYDTCFCRSGALLGCTRSRAKRPCSSSTIGPSPHLTQAT